jgi:hypothetical protein
VGSLQEEEVRRRGIAVTTASQPEALAEEVTMRRLLATMAGVWLIPLSVLASGGEPATALEHHVDTSSLTGSNLLLANLYNDNRVLYAAVTTVAMGFFGIAIAFVVDGLLGKLGLKVSKVEHRE